MLGLRDPGIRGPLIAGRGLGRRISKRRIEDPDDRIAKQYAVAAIPHLFTIGRDGRVLAVHTGYGAGSIQQMVDDINAALQAPPPSSE